MSDDVKFLFQTRTTSEDYRVLEDDGSTMIPYEEFKPFYVKAEIENEDEQSAIIFENDGRIYTVAFGLRLGKLDRAGREIRFSFCVSLTEGEKRTAMRIFSRVVKEWSNTAETVSGLIREIPVSRKDWKGRDVRGEDVRFDHNKFLRWLTEKPADPKIKFPPKGHVLKYFADGGELALIRNEDDESDSGESYTGSRRKNRLPIICAVLALVLCAGLGFWGWKQSQELQGLYQKLQTEQQNVSELESKLANRDEEISGLKKRLADKEKEIESLKKKQPSASGGVKK